MFEEGKKIGKGFCFMEHRYINIEYLIESIQEVAEEYKDYEQDGILHLGKEESETFTEELMRVVNRFVKEYSESEQEEEDDDDYYVSEYYDDEDDDDDLQ